MDAMSYSDLEIFNFSLNGTDCIIDDTNDGNEWKLLGLVFSLECILALFSIIVNIIFLIIIRKVKVMPQNVRYLLAHLSFTFIWVSIASVYKIISFLTTPDSCSLRINSFRCKLEELPFNLPSNATFYSLLGICAERLVSTFYKRHRDHVTTPPIMAIVFVLIIWSASIVNYIRMMFYVTQKDISLPVCESALGLDPDNAIKSVIRNLSFELIALLVMITVSAYENYVAKNMAINRVLYRLSSRFTIIQNFEVNALMLPSTILHVLCFVPNMIFFLLVILHFPMKPSTLWMMVHLTYIWRIFYSICHPILAFSRNFHIRKQIEKTKCLMVLISIWRKSKSTVAVTGSRTAHAHFDQLEQLWAIAYRQKQRKSHMAVQNRDG